mmetsp:Transcript_12981/g.24844  ORF Transcript_12981/g.24844 Transcript_12981/m.24844 type:complete len:311 (-) Transcript_12981:252-1184(-)
MAKSLKREQAPPRIPSLKYQRRLEEALSCTKKALELMRSGYTHTFDPVFCRLRLDLMISLTYQAHGDKVYKKDPCSQLATIVEASFKNNQIAATGVKSIAKLIASVPANHPALGDVAMCLSHPDLKLLLEKEVVKLLGSLVEKKAIPRTFQRIKDLDKVLVVLYKAKHTMQHQDFSKPKVEETAVQVFYTAVASMIASKLLGESPELVQKNSKQLKNALKQSIIAREMTLPFIARAARQGDVNSIKVLLTALGKQEVSTRQFANKFVDTLNRWKKRAPQKLEGVKKEVLKWASRCGFEGVDQKVAQLYNR